jgi:flagellar hook-length control protein FliK
MMTQSVMTQAANLFGSAAGSITSKGRQNGSGFDTIIDSNLKSIQNKTGNDHISTEKKTPVRKADKQDYRKSDESDDSVGQSEQTKDTSQTGAARTEAANQKQTAKTEETTATEKTEEDKKITTEQPTEYEMLLAQISGMLQKLQEAVMEQLNLTSEELDQLLAEQGMSITDLLQPEKLQQLVLASKGVEDILAALTDEDLAGTMKQLLETVEGIKSESGLGITVEQMKEILSQAESQALSKAETEQQTIVPTVKSTEEDNLPLQTNAANAVNGNREEDAGNITNSDVAKNISSDATKLTDTAESNNGAHTDNESKEQNDLKASDQFQTFIENLVKASPDTKVDFSGNMTRVTELRDIANQIIERIKVSITTDQSSMELQLNPENLGKVNLSVQSKNGVMTAQFVVQNELSKEAIESQLHTLRETLNQQGIRVEAIEVTVSANAFEQNSNEASGNQADAQKNSTGKQISLEDALNMTEIPEDESMTEDVSGTLGSRIDYTA